VTSLEIEPPAVFTSTGHRDRVAVVLDEVDDRELEVAGGVDRLPELALDVVPSPVETKTTSSALNPSVMPSALARTRFGRRPPAGTACRWATSWRRC
jgi:hypothetical protein